MGLLQALKRIYPAGGKPDGDFDPYGRPYAGAEREKITELAKHRATMVIFLSVGMIEELCEMLCTSYDEDTPAAVVYKATWEDERIVRGTLKDIAGKVKEAGITKTALTVVGNFLGDDYELSKLYDKTFTTEFRQGTAKS